MTIIFTYTPGQLVTGTPEQILSAGALHTTECADNDHGISESISNLLSDYHSVRHQVPILLGHPSHWPLIRIDSLKEIIISASNKIASITLVPNALLVAYAVAKGICLTVEVGGSGDLSVAAIFDFTFSRSLSIDCVKFDENEFMQSIEMIMHGIDAGMGEKKAALLENMIVCGPGHNAEIESKVIDCVTTHMQAVSAYSADHQPRHISAKHIPDYHVDAWRSCPHLQQYAAAFGGAIAQKTLI